MNKLLTTLAVVVTLFAPCLQAQVSLSSGPYTEEDIRTLLGNTRTITIPDFSLVELDGDWNLKNLGPITITIKGSGCIVFSGYGDNAERMRLAQGSSIIIEEGALNPFALLGTGISDQKRIKVGDDWYKEKHFQGIINGYGVSSVLPIQLAYFRANLKESAVQLNWSTEIEINNAYFDIEHSTNGKDFKSIAYIEGAGTSTKALFYDFQHKTPVRGINYYRLKQTDFDESFSYSDIVSVEYNEGYQPTVKVFPNPVIDRFTITHNSEEALSQVQLISVLGQQLVGRWTQEQTSYNLPSSLAPGQYILRMRAGAKEWLERIIVQ
ncbi:MAG: T9SS type A sorting domain-containing protein [Saprospiraceae bacterium]|nr:T9SS type A sorting domain-containing protein [Saprospiraceae bacterium]